METKAFLNRSELANKYGISDKQFQRTLSRHGLYFNRVRLLSPKQVDQIIEELGHWDNTHEKPVNLL